MRSGLFIPSPSALHISSSSSGKAPTWRTLPCSYNAATGSARACLPRVACTARNDRVPSTSRITASTMAPPWFTSATTRLACRA